MRDDFRDKWPDMRMKHLELIQNALSRMGTNSASLKGYCITVVGAVIALSAAVKQPEILLYTMPIVVGMSVLDASYLALEKGFRQQYNDVRSCKIDCEPNFEINPTYSSLSEAYWSWSVAAFYGITVLVLLVLYVAMRA